MPTDHRKVPWPDLSRVLSAHFEVIVGTALTHAHLQCLASKLFRGQTTVDYSNRHATWRQFAKSPLRDGNFSFWEWFNAAMILIANEAKEIWNHGLIIGFISRKEAENMLQYTAPGTFLIRFSDRILGGLTIAFKHSVTKKVLMISPLTERDLKVTSLTKWVINLSELVYLFPRQPKEEAFKDFYTLDPVELESILDPIMKQNGFSASIRDRK